MNAKTKNEPAQNEPTEDDIRDYAYHLYEQSGCIPGRDIDNWLEARACLLANIPTGHVHRRLHVATQERKPEPLLLLAPSPSPSRRVKKTAR